MITTVLTVFNRHSYLESQIESIKDQTIDSDILNLNFQDNLIEILENVYYVNQNTKIKADKVEIDLLDKKLKISMINKKDKVNITSKY